MSEDCNNCFYRYIIYVYIIMQALFFGLSDLMNSELQNVVYVRIFLMLANFAVYREMSKCPQCLEAGE